ncbi:MAG: GNAT family N-acetyltransferase [Gemmatimonadetes bacterium]|nr:GNAT family N-acetyltransferase [Gemmatimonadota bacterium]
MGGISLERIRPRFDASWDAFLDEAPDATLFDRLAFLAYHPADRFREHRLRAVRNDRTIGIVALAESTDGESTFLVSPYGGSVGGWVVSDDVRGSDHVVLAELLHDYACAHAFDRVVLGTRPAPYRSSGEWSGFAWGERGAVCSRRDINHFVPLAGDPQSRFRGSARRSARRAEREGLVARRLAGENVTGDDLARAHIIVRKDKARKQARPTHSFEELRFLFRRFPDSFALRVAERPDGDWDAVLLEIRASARVSLVFYANRADEDSAHGAVNLLYERAIVEAAEAGYEWLDLGTSSIGGRVNDGLARFKESLGGVAFARESWALDVARATTTSARREVPEPVLAEGT